MYKYDIGIFITIYMMLGYIIEKEFNLERDRRRRIIEKIYNGMKKYAKYNLNYYYMYMYIYMYTYVISAFIEEYFTVII